MVAVTEVRAWSLEALGQERPAHLCPTAQGLGFVWWEVNMYTERLILVSDPLHPLSSPRGLLYCFGSWPRLAQLSFFSILFGFVYVLFTRLLRPMSFKHALRLKILPVVFCFLIYPLFHLLQNLFCISTQSHQNLLNSILFP